MKFISWLVLIVNWLISHTDNSKGNIMWLSPCACAQSLQLYPTLWDPMDCSPPGSSVLGISQATILAWIGTPFSRASSWPRDWTSVSSIGLFTTEPPGKHDLKKKKIIANWSLLCTNKVGINDWVELYKSERTMSRGSTLLCGTQLLCSHEVVSSSLQPHKRQHARFPCPSLSPRVCSDSCLLS